MLIFANRFLNITRLMGKLKILMIGGTGTISSAITRQLAASGHELRLLNRGTRKQEVPGGVKQVIADIDDKAATVIFDCTKLKRAVPGYQATTRFDEGVRRCVNYMLAHPELQVEEPEFDQWCDKVIEAQEQAKNMF